MVVSEGELLPVKKAVALFRELGCPRSEDTIRRWIKTGLLPARQAAPGTSIWIDPADVRALASRPKR